jgi:hypothetical protein
MTILTTLSDYAKQKGITRARAYQLQSKLSTIDLPVYAESTDGTKIPLYKDDKPLIQTFVQLDRGTLQCELQALIQRLKHCNVHEAGRIGNMIAAIKTILK